MPKVRLRPARRFRPQPESRQLPRAKADVYNEDRLLTQNSTTQSASRLRSNRYRLPSSKSSRLRETLDFRRSPGRSPRMGMRSAKAEIVSKTVFSYDVRGTAMVLRELAQNVSDGVGEKVIDDPPPHDGGEQANTRYNPVVGTHAVSHPFVCLLQRSYKANSVRETHHSPELSSPSHTIRVRER